MKWTSLMDFVLNSSDSELTELQEVKMEELALQLLKKHEGYRQKMYRDTVGKLTVGYGRNLEDVGISQPEAEFLLKTDIKNAVKYLESEFYWPKLNEVRKAVCIDMCVNMGYPRYFMFQKMRGALEKEDYLTASKEMLLSKWATQVGYRANELSELMRKGEV